MAERVKPTEAAKRLEIRPQIIYGLIKRGKVKTFDNPNGTVALVDYDDVKIAVSRMGHRGPRKERALRGSRPPKGIRRGTILSQDRFPIKGAFARPNGGNRAVRVVTDPGRGEGTLVWLSDGTIETFWGTETLAQRLEAKTTTIEDPGALLGMIAFQWRQSEETQALADKLEAWAAAEDIPYVPIHVGLRGGNEDEQTDETPAKPPAPVIEVEIPEEGIDLSKIAL